MFHNYVKEYLDSGKTLEDLKKEYGINSNIFNNLVIFSYSQIDSPKTNLIVRMCRGLILEKDTWKIVNYPFYRFYNFEEVFDERKKFNWDNAVSTTKIDGSLLCVFFYNNAWYISTRSQIGGMNMVMDGIHTFNNLFDFAIAPLSRDDFFNGLCRHIYDDKNEKGFWKKGSLCFTFELVSPFNIIVTPYSESKLWLIGARHLIDDGTHFFQYEEIPFDIIYNSLESEVREVIKIPNIIPLIDDSGKFRGFDEMKKLSESVAPTDEGFVVVDFSTVEEDTGSFPRAKVKNSAYVALHHLSGTFCNGPINYQNILAIVIKNETDEIYATFPQYSDIIDNVKNKWIGFSKYFDSIMSENVISEFFLMNFNDRNTVENKKLFAQSIIKYKKYSSFLFFMFNNNISNINDCINKMMVKKSSSNFLKNLWENYIKSFEIVD